MAPPAAGELEYSLERAGDWGWRATNQVVFVCSPQQHRSVLQDGGLTVWCGPAGGPAPAGLGPQDAVWDWAGEQLPSKREQQLVHLLPLLTDQAVYVLAGDHLQLTHLTSLLGQADSLDHLGLVLILKAK